MEPDDVTIEVLDRTLTRQAQILPDHWNLKTTSILRAVGAWEMRLPAELPAAQRLSVPGASILITGPAGELFSGPVAAPGETGSQTDPLGTATFTGTDWNVLLEDPLAYPTPATDDLTAQTSAYDVRKGAAETVVRGLVDANIGPSAPPARRAAFAQLLTLPPDQGRGGTVTSSSRFDNLLTQIAAAGKTGGLAFQVGRTGQALELRMWLPGDRTRQVRLDIENGTLSAYDYKVTAPKLTRVVLGGQGEAAARTFRERTSADSTAAETLWGRRIEVFKDQRNTNDPDELDDAGDEILADGGATATTLKLTPTEATDGMLYHRDYALGDFITAVIHDQEIPQIVSQVGMSFSSAGVTVGIRNGDLDDEDFARLHLLRQVRRLQTNR